METQAVIDYFSSKAIQFQLSTFGRSVKMFFEENPLFTDSKLPIIHSVKSRIKDPDHLMDKIKRIEEKKNIVINEGNLIREINDLFGVRVMHLYFDQFIIIHNAIQKQIEDGEWVLFEEPKAYSWDPEMVSYFSSLGINTHTKDSYTSVHYVIKPNNKEDSVCCEIQVRTLFEEIWGEIDHTINYPYPTDSIACKEQLKVLSKLVSTGTRLADSIFRSHKEYQEK
ncbi:MAG: (p)ppGpp synthetase [Bacteroidota bacterium]